MKYTVLCLFVSVVLQAAAFSPTDSVGIIKLGNTFVIVHKVEKGEGLLAIARRYNVTADEIKAINKGLKNPVIGQKINIPISKQITKPGNDSTKITVDESHANADAKEFAGEKKHLVVQGETVAKIAAKYKISTQQLIKWNNIKNNTVSPGQELRVSGVTTIKPYEKWNEANGTSARIDSPRNILSSPVKSVEEFGLPQEKEKVTHPTLPIGSFVLLINPETQKQLLLQIEHNTALQDKCIIGISRTEMDSLGISTQLPLTIRYNLP